MGRPPKERLRAFEDDELAYLEMLSRAHSAPAVQVVRAKLLLAVSQGLSYKQAAASVGRKDGDPVSWLVSRFNEEGLDALIPRHGGGPETIYGPDERERILREFRRQPSLAEDGTAVWSISTLQRALRSAPDGFPEISTHTIWKILREAGYRYQKDQSWCRTGIVKRKRKTGVIEVHDPQAELKKTDRKGLPVGRKNGIDRPVPG